MDAVIQLSGLEIQVTDCQDTPRFPCVEAPRQKLRWSSFAGILSGEYANLFILKIKFLSLLFTIKLPPLK